MKFLGTKNINLAKAHLPGDMGKRRKTSGVRDLAASIKSLGGEPIHMPTIDKNGNIVTGRDRTAAMLELGAKLMAVRIVDGTPLELQALEISENLHRRSDDRNQMIARYVDVMERLLTPELGFNESKPVGRPQSARGAAREAVAEITGIPVNTIKTADRRAHEIEPPKMPDVKPSYRDDFNLAIEGVTGAIAAARSSLCKLDAARHPIVARSCEELGETGKMLERAWLETECPRCPGEKCPLCLGLGWLTEFQAAALPVDERPRALLTKPAPVLDVDALTEIIEAEADVSEDDF